MLKRKHTIYALAAVLISWQLAGNHAAAQCCIDPCKSTVTANPGVVLVCPKGDGDLLTDTVGGINCKITLTVKDYAGIGIVGIPEFDMWLTGCTNGLLLCGLSSGSSADGPTNAQGQTTFSRALAAGGCDTGLFVVAQGVVMQDPHTCMPLCIPIATRSPDYKSVAGCPGDNLCPDGKVDSSDFSWFVTHYPTTANPGAPYFACAEFAAPLGAPIGLPDFTKFVSHYFGNHRCNPI